MHSRLLTHLALAVLTISSAFLTGCVSTGGVGGKTLTTDTYDVTAYRAANPSNVRVKVSTTNQAVYVMEGSKPLLVTAVTVGKPGSETPKGNFKIYSKNATRRNGTYGYWVKGGQIVEGKSSKPPGGGWSFRGYPMPYWCEFSPAYGFHTGFVHPTPRSHGCIRLPRHVAPKFFALVRTGTPLNIASSQPEDRTIGANLARPNDAVLPNPDPAFMMGNASYTWHSPVTLN